ncbi:MAG: glycosyltransferase family 4 protein [Alphaproteobacteria bacterium]
MAVETVIIVNECASVDGGQARVAIDSALGLAARGLRVVYFAATGPVGAELAGAGIETVCLGQSDFVDSQNSVAAIAQGIWNRGAAAELKALMQRYDPASTIVHFHGIDKGLSPSIGRAIVNGPLPHLLTMHGFFLACPNGAFFDHQTQTICTRRGMGAACLSTNCDSRKFVHKYWRVARQAAMLSAGALPRGLKNIAYISETERRVLADYLPPAATLAHVPNPISVNQGPAVAAAQNDAFVFVGRLSPEKGCVDFAKMAQAAGVRAVFVGEGPEREAILAVNPDAEITGWVDGAGVEAWLQQARALVFPSLWYETFGLVAYEALAKGVPVIVGGWNAAAEGVKHGETGLIYENSADLATMLEQAKSDNLIARLSTQAYAQYWANPLTIDRHVDRLLDVYEQILA